MDAVFGPNNSDILWWQMAIRGVVIFVYGLVVIRLAGQRIFGKGSALDLIVAIIMGSTLSRTMTGPAPLGPTLAATTVLIALHWGLARLSRRLPRLERLIKGTAEQVVADGLPVEKTMARHGISNSDLGEAARQAGLSDQQPLPSAFVEPNGRISVIRSPANR